MLCAFIDESLSLSPEGDYFVAVAAVITDERRRLELMVRRLKRLPKLKAHSELKASVTPPQMIMKFLSSLANNSALEKLLPCGMDIEVWSAATRRCIRKLWVDALCQSCGVIRGST